MPVVASGRFKFDFGLITVEPVLFLYMVGSFLTYPTFQAFVYNKVCLHNYNQSFCEALQNKTFQTDHRDEENLVQSETSHWILKKNVTELVPSFLIVLLFLGSLGDKVGRKLPVLLPCGGATVASLCYLLMSVFSSSKLEYIYIATVFNGLCGAFTALLMSVYSYVTHIADAKNRTVRVGVLEAMTFIAACFGVFVSGVMLDNTSFTFVFGFICICNCLAFLYALVRLENIKATEIRYEGQGCCDYWMLESLKESCRCIRKPREEKRKLYLVLLLIVFIILSLGTSAEIDVLLLYTRRAPLNWSQTTFGYYKGLENFTRSITLLTVLPLCKKFFSIKDTTLSIVGLLSKAIGLVVIGLAKQTWLIFIVVVLAMFQGMPATAVRSMLSGTVQKDEQGRLFGMVGALESLATLLASLMFNEIYPASLSFFPGFTFLLAASLSVIGMTIMIWLHLDTRGVISYDTLSETEPTPASVNRENPHYQSTGLPEHEKSAAD